VLKNECSVAYGLYTQEISGRREYLKWFTSLLGPGIVLAGYFMSKNQPFLIVSVLIFLIVLGLATFRVVLASSLTVLEATSRLARVQSKLRSSYPRIADSLREYTVSYCDRPDLRRFPILSFKLPYIVTIFIVLNSAMLATFVFLVMQVSLESGTLIRNIFLTVATYCVSHILHRVASVKSYETASQAIVEVSRRDHVTNSVGGIRNEDESCEGNSQC
jgi:regulator of protease activity HflC (stomatin/prohibitin superfamily)